MQVCVRERIFMYGVKLAQYLESTALHLVHRFLDLGAHVDKPT